MNVEIRNDHERKENDNLSIQALLSSFGIGGGVVKDFRKVTHDLLGAHFHSR